MAWSREGAAVGIRDGGCQDGEHRRGGKGEVCVLASFGGGAGTEVIDGAHLAF